MLRGHDADDDFGIRERAGQIIRRRDRLRQLEAGQKALVDLAAGNTLANLWLVGPEPDGVRSLASQNDGQPGAPGARADDGNPAHPRLAPNFGSIPAARRAMLWR